MAPGIIHAQDSSFMFREEMDAKERSFQAEWAPRISTANEMYNAATSFLKSASSGGEAIGVSDFGCENEALSDIYYTRFLALVNQYSDQSAREGAHFNLLYIEYQNESNEFSKTDKYIALSTSKLRLSMYNDAFTALVADTNAVRLFAESKCVLTRMAKKKGERLGQFASESLHNLEKDEVTFDGHYEEFTSTATYIAGIP
jgi:hypothetical protein